MAGFVLLLIYRVHALWGLAAAAGIGLSGTAIYAVRARMLREWPFTGRGAQD
jgi:hypothetical protein